MGISVSGLGSGFDWQTMIDQLKQAEVTAKINPLTSQKTKLQSKVTAWKSLADKLSALKTAVDGMTETTDFDLFKTTLTSSNPSVSAGSLLSATAGSGAGRGRFEVQVNQIAKAEKLQSTTVTTKTDSTGWTGSITLAGHEVTLDGKSLISLRDELNALNTGDDPSGVIANILQVSTNDYRLILTSEEAGAAGIALTDAPGNYFLDTPLQDGADAAFSIDGISMTRSSNTVTDAVPGVTLNLLAGEGETPTTTVTVDVTSDGEAMESKVKAFITAYNDVLEAIRQQMTYNAESKTTGGALFGDTIMKSIKSNLQNLFLNSEISDLGVTVGSDNKLALDSEKLQTAMETDFSGNVTIFNNMAEDFSTALKNYTDSIDGAVTLQEDSLKKSITNLERRITTTQNRIDDRMEILTRQYISMESALSQMQAQLSYLTSQLGTK